MCINKPNPQVWPATYWAFCDHSQYRRNKETWETYNGIILNSTNVRARKPNQIVIPSRPSHGFSHEISRGYHIGRSSTYAAMQIISYLDYDKAYLFGVDMTNVGDKLHFYGQNPDVSNEKRKQRFAAEAQHYQWAATHLHEHHRQRYIFCSNHNPWPFTKHFPTHDHTTALQHILQQAQQPT